MQPRDIKLSIPGGKWNGVVEIPEGRVDDVQIAIPEGTRVETGSGVRVSRPKPRTLLLILSSVVVLCVVAGLVVYFSAFPPPLDAEVFGQVVAGVAMRKTAARVNQAGDLLVNSAVTAERRFATTSSKAMVGRPLVVHRNGGLEPSVVQNPGVGVLRSKSVECSGARTQKLEIGPVVGAPVSFQPGDSSLHGYPPNSRLRLDSNSVVIAEEVGGGGGGVENELALFSKNSVATRSGITLTDSGQLKHVHRIQGDNVVFGAACTNLAGQGNVFMLTYAGNTTGNVAGQTSNHCVALGRSAAPGVGDSNVCVGDATGSSSASGDRNIALGQNSGSQITTGNDGIFLGPISGPNLTPGTDDQIVIGGGHHRGQGSIVVGNSNFTTVRPSVGNQTNLGSPNRRYRDIYLTGNVVAGTYTQPTLTKYSISSELTADTFQSQTSQTTTYFTLFTWLLTQSNASSVDVKVIGITPVHTALVKCWTWSTTTTSPPVFLGGYSSITNNDDLRVVVPVTNTSHIHRKLQFFVVHTNKPSWTVHQ